MSEGSPTGSEGSGGLGRDANASGAVCSTAELPDHMVCVDDPEEMLDPRAYNVFFDEIVLTHVAALCCGVLGNGVVILVMVGERKARTATNLFLGSLAAADLLLLLVYGPLEALQYFVTQWDEAGAVCKLARGAQLLSASASVLNLAAVTLERFLVIVFPMKSRPYCTLSNCRRAVVVVWVVAALLTAPVFLTKGTHRMVYTNLETNITLYHCTETGLVFVIYQFIILFGAPGILMIICYSFVIRELWRSTHKMCILTNTPSSKGIKNSKCYANNIHNQKSTSSCDLDIELSKHHDLEISNQALSGEGQAAQVRSKISHIQTRAHVALPERISSKQHNRGEDVRKARKQVVKMLILVIVLFLACWGPRIIMEIFMKFGIATYSPIIYQIRIAIFALPVIHACMNPFIYSFMSQNFRKSLKKLLDRVCCKDKIGAGGSSVSGTYGSRYGSSRRSRRMRQQSSQGDIRKVPLQGTARVSTSLYRDYNSEAVKQIETEHRTTDL